MNKGIAIISIIITLLLWGCESPVVSETLKTDKKELSFNENEGSSFVNITSNAKWTVSIIGNATWIECSSMSGEGNAQLTITVRANESETIRTCAIRIATSGGDVSETINVTQSTEAPYITTQPTIVAAFPSGEELSIKVLSNKEWTTNIPDDLKEWVSVKSKTEDEALLLVKENDTGKERSGSIVFRLTNFDTQAILKLTQEKFIEPYFVIDPEVANIESDEADVYINVSSNQDWEVGETEDWITMKRKERDYVQLLVAENNSGKDRSSIVCFLNGKGDKIKELTINQKVGYTLSGSLNPTAEQIGLSYSQMNLFMQKYGFDYTEHPACSGLGGHSGNEHLAVEYDAVADKHVFRFDIHIDPIIDGDRCFSNSTDRQRNELKSVTGSGSTCVKLNGHWDEWQIIEYKFKIPKGFQPTSSFCHLHQIKAQDGLNNVLPLITISLRANSNGLNRRLQVLHSQSGTNTGKGILVDNVPLTDLEDEWLQVWENIHYTHSGAYSCKITRVRDGKVLVDFTDNNIDMWNSGSSVFRSKFGIYRSLAGGDLNNDPVGQSPLLKNESIWMYDLNIYEKNSNPNPSHSHN